MYFLSALAHVIANTHEPNIVVRRSPAQVQGRVVVHKGEEEEEFTLGARSPRTAEQVCTRKIVRELWPKPMQDQLADHLPLFAAQWWLFELRRKA